MKTDAPVSPGGQVSGRMVAPANRTWSNGDRAALASITALALVLRLIQVNSGLWMDEASASFVAFRKPLLELISNYPGDIHHPLYSILAHVSITVFGEYPWSMRLPALIAGVLTVPIIFQLADRVASRPEAWCTALLTAVSYPHIWFSQNARGYTLLALFATLTTLLLLRLIQSGRWQDLGLYALAAGLGAFTHVTMVFIVVGHATVWLGLLAYRLVSQQPPGTTLWRSALAFPLAALATITLYSTMIRDVMWWFLDRPSELVGVSTPGWALAEAKRIVTQSYGADAIVLAALLVGAVGFFSYLRRTTLPLALFVAPGMVTIFGAVVARGTMYPRFFFALSAFGFLIFIRGLFVCSEALRQRVSSEWPRRIPWIAVALMAAVSLVALTKNYAHPKQDYLGAITFLNASSSAKDEIIGIGAAKYPYRDYWEMPWHFVESIGHLEQVRSRQGSTWLVYTFPRYIAAASPGIYSLIQDQCSDQTVFRGTVGDGDIRVCRLPPTESPG